MKHLSWSQVMLDTSFLWEVFEINVLHMYNKWKDFSKVCLMSLSHSKFVLDHVDIFYPYTWINFLHCMKWQWNAMSQEWRQSIICWPEINMPCEINLFIYTENGVQISYVVTCVYTWDLIYITSRIPCYDIVNP